MSRIDEINTILDSLGGGATYEQVEFALRGYEKREVLDVLADRSLSASGEAFNGGTITEPLVVENSDKTVTPLVAQAATDQTTISDADLFAVKAPDGDDIVRVSPQGGMYLELSGHPGAPAAQLGLSIIGTGDDADDYILVTDGAASIFSLDKGGVELYGNRTDADVLYVEALAALDVGINLVSIRPASGTNRIKVTRGCFLKFKATAAPADAELEASECAFWFDSTNGASKLKIKGKSANGTVVNGEVALT